MSQFNNPFQTHNLMLNNHNGQSDNTVGTLIPPRYDPYAQTSNEFGQQMGRFLDAPANPPFFQTPGIDQSFEGLFESLSAQHLPVAVSDVCIKGHKHPRWPRKGDLDIKKCERRCDYCKKKVGNAAGLRKHVFLHKTQDGLDINILRSRSGPNRPALDFSGNGDQIIDLEHDTSITPGSSASSLEPSTTHTQHGNMSSNSKAYLLGSAQGSTSSTAQRGPRSTEQESETVSPRESRASLEVDSIENLRSSLETSLEARIVPRLEAQIEARLRAESEANFEAKVRAAVDEQLEARIDERLKEFLFFTPELSRATQSEEKSGTQKIIESQVEIQKQQAAIVNAISRIRKDNNQLYEQSMAFQTLHDRHENSINAILTFLATVYNRSLDAKGPINISQMFSDGVQQPDVPPKENSQSAGVQEEHDTGVTKLMPVAGSATRPRDAPNKVVGRLSGL